MMFERINKTQSPIEVRFLGEEVRVIESPGGFEGLTS